MDYVIVQYAQWIAVALCLGLLVGLYTWQPRPQGNWLSGWMRWATAVLAAGILASIFKVFPGRSGLWLESALILFVAYVVGCQLGSWLRGLFAAPEVLPAVSEPVIAATPTASTGTPAEAAEGSPATAFPAAPENAPLAIDSSSAYPGRRPAAAAAGGNAVDDLTRIAGLTAVDQKILNDLGVLRLEQIAGWSPENAAWINHHMAQAGRVEAADWIGQASRLAGDQISAPSGSAVAAVAAASAGALSSAQAAEPVPVAADPGAIDAKHPGTRPQGLERPRGDEVDDLLKIKGIGKANLKQLHALGIFHFDQIAAWTTEECKWVGGYLAFPSRIEGEDWVGQAKDLARRRAIELANRAATHHK